jgi:hypothetical protein
MQSGWRSYELRDFLLRKEELESLEWDQVKYTPADLDKEGKFIGGVRGDKAADLPAGLADMAGPPPGSEYKKKGKKGKKGAAPTPRRAPEPTEEPDDVDDGFGDDKPVKKEL